MTSVKSNLLQLCYDKKNVGGTYRLQIVYRDAIAITPFKFLDKQIKFLYSTQYLFDEYAQIIKVENNLSNTYSNRTLKVMLDASVNVETFQSWFNENLLNRIVSLILTDENEEKEVLHFMKATDFTKVSTAQRNTAKSIEIQFVPSKIKPENLHNNFEPIDTDAINLKNVVYPLQSGSEIKYVNIEVILKDFVDKNLVRLLKSNDQNIKNATPFNYVSNLQTGTYYLFAVCVNAPQNVQKYKLQIDTEAESDITLI